MELTNEQILIQLPEGTDKNAMFTIIALANGWTPRVNENQEKTLEIKGRVETETRIAELKEQGFTFNGADQGETDEDFIIKYTEIVEVQNPIEVTVFGKNILVAQMFDTFGKAKLQLDTQAEQIALAEKQEQSKQELETIGDITVE